MTPGAARGPEALERFGLHAGGYVLFVGRLVPEKAPDLTVELSVTLEDLHQEDCWAEMASQLRDRRRRRAETRRPS